MIREIAGPADRVLDAAGMCIARVGLAKTTLDDVARQAGCARATVYRYFPGKQQLLAAYLDREVATFQRQLLDASGDAPSVADAATAVVMHASAALQSHEALGFVVANELELLLPLLAFERGSVLLGTAGELAAPAFTRFLSLDDATRLAEWVARITLSYLCSPSEHVDLADEGHVRALIEDFVLPGFRTPAGTTEGATP
jgi:AcrR family transcriptional regulator